MNTYSDYINYNKLIDNGIKKELLFYNNHFDLVLKYDVDPVTRTPTFYDSKSFKGMEERLNDLFEKNSAYPIKMTLDNLKHTRMLAERNIQIFPARFGCELFFKKSIIPCD